MSGRIIIATLLLLAVLAAGARAAVVTLKDGSTLRGAIAGQTADGIELVTPDGTLHIGYARILRVDYAEPPPNIPAAPSFEASPPPPVRAMGDRRDMLSLGIGLIQPVSRINFHSIGGGSADNGELGAQIGLQYVHSLTRRLGAGVDADYFDRGATASERLFPASSASVGGDTWLMLGVLRYSFTDRNRARPFLLLGAGGAWNSETVDVDPDGNWADTGTHETRRLIDDSAWVPAASVRLGLDFDVDALEPAVLAFELGWTGLASARYGATPQGQAQGLSNIAAPLNIVSFTARYGFRF